MNAPWNTQWNTPPNGDFVRYVEQITARSAALARTHRGRSGQHEFDEADSDYVEAHQQRQIAEASEAAEAQSAVVRSAPPGPPMLDELFSRGARSALDALRGKLEQSIQNSRKTR